MGVRVIVISFFPSCSSLQREQDKSRGSPAGSGKGSLESKDKVKGTHIIYSLLIMLALVLLHYSTADYTNVSTVELATMGNETWRVVLSKGSICCT